jgi:hypothetical protein
MQGARLGVTAAVSAGDRSMRDDEMVPVGDLGGSIGRREVLVERVTQLGTPVAAALAAAHERGIVHRDLGTSVQGFVFERLRVSRRRSSSRAM